MTVETHKVEVEVTREMFYDVDSFFGIYALKPTEYDSNLSYNKYGNISSKGSTRPLKAGKKYVVTIEGAYSDNYGEFYKILSVEADRLETVYEQDSFLKAVLTDNQFKSFKEAYPDELLVDFILQDKIDHTKVKGIGAPSLAKIKEKVNQNMNISILISKLNSLSLSTNAINKLLEHFGSSEKVIASIEKDIYSLCEVKQFGFLTVDKVALARGDNPTNEPRIKACIDYILTKDNQNGHTWSYTEELLEQAEELLQITPHLINNVIVNLTDGKDYYIEGDRIAYSYIYKQEQEVYKHLKRIQDNYIMPRVENIPSKIKELEAIQGFDFTEEQYNTMADGARHGVMTVNGKSGVGKCVRGDTLVFTDKGLMRIDEVDKRFQVSENDDVDATIVSYDTIGESKHRKTSKFYDMGVSKTLRIKTRQGYEIEGTPEHPLLIVDDKGDLVYKKLEDFDGREVIPISLNNNLFGKSRKVSKDIAYFLGAIIGDGSTSGINLDDNKKTKNYTMSFSSGNLDIYNKISGIAAEHFNYKRMKSTIPMKREGSYQTSFGNKNDTPMFIKKYDLPVCLSRDKYIPKSIMSSPKSIVKSFLQGLFDTDGSITGNMFEYSTASKRLAREVHTMLLNFGIASNLRVKKVKAYPDNDYYIISINERGFLKKLYDEIGFKLELSKQEKLSVIVNSPKVINSNINILTNMNEKILDIREYFLQSDNRPSTFIKKFSYAVPFSDGTKTTLNHVRDKRLSKDGHRKSLSSNLIRKLTKEYPDIPHSEYLSNISNNMFIDYIDTIEESNSHVYDFTVPETHSFVANGFINHNTTVLKGLISALGTPNYMTCALSGAAVRVLDLSGVEASTIHRMLGYSQKEGFTYDEEYPMPYDLIIVDEISMVAIPLFLSVVRAVKNGAKLVLTGDSGQLSGIGYGNFIRDLLETKAFPTYELTQVHRQAAKSGILSLANEIRDGVQPIPYNSTGKSVYGEIEDMTVLSYADKGAIPYDILAIAENYKEKVESPEDLLDFQVLVAVRERGDLSVRSINNELQRVFNDVSKEGLKRNGYTFLEGDKIIAQGNSYKRQRFNSLEDYEDSREKEYMNGSGQVESHYDENIFSGEQEVYVQEDEEETGNTVNVYNGTLGYIYSIVNKTALIKFVGIEGLVAFSQAELEDVDMAYAITTHKSQGSSIKNVVFALDFGAYTLLSRQLVYVALTRATDKCIMLCEGNALYKAVGNDESGNRRTFLQDIIKEDKLKHIKEVE